jgi:hypothetical protein
VCQSYISFCIVSHLFRSLDFVSGGSADLLPRNPGSERGLSLYAGAAIRTNLVFGPPALQAEAGTRALKPERWNNLLLHGTVHQCAGLDQHPRSLTLHDRTDGSGHRGSRRQRCLAWTALDSLLSCGLGVIEVAGPVSISETLTIFSWSQPSL